AALVGEDREQGYGGYDPQGVARALDDGEDAERQAEPERQRYGKAADGGAEDQEEEQRRSRVHADVVVHRRADEREHRVEPHEKSGGYREHSPAWSDFACGEEHEDHR